VSIEIDIKIIVSYREDMIRFVFLLPFFLSHFRPVKHANITRIFSLKPFVFPNENRPNISDSETYENFTDMNETEYFLMIEDMVIYTLKNESKCESTINF